MSTDNSVKFLHFRYPSSKGGFESRGGRTFAYLETAPGEFRVGVSKCHPNDNFRKSLARARAAGRLLSVKEGRTIKGSYDDLLATVTQEAKAFGMVRKFANKKKESVLPASQCGLVACI